MADLTPEQRQRIAEIMKDDPWAASMASAKKVGRALGPPTEWPGKVVGAVTETFKVPGDYAKETQYKPGTEEWQHLENVKADRAAQWAPDWAMNVLGVGRLGGGVKGGLGAGGGKIVQPQPSESGMNMLNDVLRTTTNRGIIDALPPPPRTHGERIALRTKGMSDAEVLNSDELWAMTRDLMAQRPQSFSSAYSSLAERRLGRPLTAEELTSAMMQGAEAGAATPRALYAPEPDDGLVAALRRGKKSSTENE